MLAFIARRLLQSILVMLTVGFIAFSLFNFVGDPVDRRDRRVGLCEDPPRDHLSRNNKTIGSE